MFDLLDKMEAEGWARLECVSHGMPPERWQRIWWKVSGLAMFWAAQGLFYFMEAWRRAGGGRAALLAAILAAVSLACTLTAPSSSTLTLPPSASPSSSAAFVTLQPYTQSTMPTVTFARCVVTAHALTLRAAPSHEAAAITHIPGGTALEVVDDRSDWWQVITPGGMLGYINSKFCERR